MRRRAGAPNATNTEALPTPLPKVNYTLLGLERGVRSSAPPQSREHSSAVFEKPLSVPSDAELDALLRQVDTNLEQTIEMDARTVRPPWLRRRRRTRIWAGLVLYVAAGSASFLWFAERARRSVPAAEPTAPDTEMAAVAPVEPVPAVNTTGVSAQSAEPAAGPVIAAPLHARKAERRVVASKKAKRAKLLARAKRKKRAARAAARVR